MKVDEALGRQFGLSSDEYANMLAIMGRTPTLTELGIFSVMWSEHCSYKSSRVWLKTLPTQAPWVIHGPGENAGVVDIGQGLAAIFKMESHNHPSFIEPYQGAATGVGGILRDVFTMGARPVANLNALRFGDPADKNTARIVDGVVKGIGGYGNCVGVPTVGGEINFHPSYNGNPLVNAMTVGIARKDRIFLSAAAGVGNPVIYVGSKTGRDGIHGATMASAEFDQDAMEKRPTVQVGDPFVEKLLIEACLELMATDAVVAIQDMGAAGLTSSAVEMAGKGGVGIELNLDHVPQRETHMSAYEMMLSESQERMLIIISPERIEQAKAIFDKWELDFAVIGHLTDTGHIVVKHKGTIEADIPLEPLADQAPLYHRPTAPHPSPEPLPVQFSTSLSLKEALLRLVGCADLASRAWVWNQYDSTIGGQTVKRPGGADAAVIRVEGTDLGLALTTDCTPRYCQANPRRGGAQAVAEAWRNLSAVGARPLAITDNLNFGNPEKPEIMGQLAECVQGMGDACRALDFPVVSGNVSLYNETKEANGSARSILPSPVVGGLGVLDKVELAMGMSMPKSGFIFIVGPTKGELGQSLWLREIQGLEAGDMPNLDLSLERKNGDFVRTAILERTIIACHDIADGGILVGLAEMVMASGFGCSLEPTPKKREEAAFWFGEDQSRYLVVVENREVFEEKAKAFGVEVFLVGQAGHEGLHLPTGDTISIEDMKKVHMRFFPEMMNFSTQKNQ
ncbi:Phosphoribosylformylglycinamidine synthase subunit PurL [Entomobacter blattae]|uniref:Phosphoribosylformylglycinamidine synthase subunit PurL n=1 Tax=Entomobacter blattae TaxID=2762277 RepID=A0A7H1NSH5_9PROT|nr:phosphoribosylformylglycinamidine synthase subunit PurL [Entomobacter blattae]QNT78735.1 Phosphoribosylformylglycinamidine synthase subunit PurL [Entomobacter blattae]